MFRSSGALAEIYPAMVLHGITTFASPDVMRFLGRKVHGAFQGEIVSDFKDRPEGIRIKHRVAQNSVKLYPAFSRQHSAVSFEELLTLPQKLNADR